MKLCPRCSCSIGWPGIDWEPLLCPKCSWFNASSAAPLHAPELPGLQMLARVGAGGMGHVYLARNEELDRYEAVKVLSADGGSAEALARFEREASIAGRLQHANLVQVYRFAQHEGQWFLTMPYVPGPSAAQVMAWTGSHPLGFHLWRELLAHKHGERSPSTPSSGGSEAEYRDTLHVCCNAMAQLARGLHSVHLAGAVHRDIKPGNILVDADGRLVLMDFGLARIADARDISRSGQVLGTAGFMSPEQINPSIFGLDHRCDIYSLGATLFALTLGRPPFSLVDADYFGLFRRIASHPAPMPRAIRRNFPRDLEDILLRCLEKNADARYASAQVLADDLERFVHFEPIAGRRARLGSRIQRVRLRWRRELDAAAMLLSATMLCVGAVCWTRASAAKTAALEWTRDAIPARERIEAGARAIGRAEVLLVGGQMGQADRWHGLAKDEFRASRGLIATWVAKHGDRARADGILAEIEVRERLFSALRTRHSGSSILAEREFRSANERAAGVARLEALCRRASAWNRLSFVTFDRCARASLRRPADAPARELPPSQEDVEAPVETVLIQGFDNEIPSPGRWLLDLIDGDGRSWTFPVWITTGGLNSQSIEIPIDPQECARRYPGAILVPGGTARLGSAWDETLELQRGQRDVYVGPFAISAREVTVGEYRQFLETPGALDHWLSLARQELPDFVQYLDRPLLLPIEWKKDSELNAGDEDRPVVGLSVIEALAYAKWKGGRLPTEDEWEKAARGPWGQLYPEGDTLDHGTIEALDGIRAVGSRSFDRSPYGVLDVISNASEWTSTVHWIESQDLDDWTQLAAEQRARRNLSVALEAYGRAIDLANRLKLSEELALLEVREREVRREALELNFDLEPVPAQSAWLGNIKSPALVIKGCYALERLPRPVLVHCDFSLDGLFIRNISRSETVFDSRVGFRVAFDVPR